MCRPRFSSSYRDVVNPNQVGPIKRDGIATPDVLVVQVRDGNVLDNDIAAPHPQPLALDGSGAPNPKDGLVAADIYGLTGSLVPCGRRSASIVTSVLDDLLTCGASAPGRADIAGLGTLGLCKVVLLGQGDDTGLVIGQKLLELVDVLRCDGSHASTTGDTSGETLNLSRDALGGGQVGKSR